MMPSTSSIREGFRAVRASLTDLLKEHPASAARVAEALRAVDEVERLVDTPAPAVASESPRRTRGKPKEYWIERTGNQQVLAEYRPDDQNPFRCPRATYDAMARVFARIEKFVKYEEVLKGLDKELRTRPADFQVRVVLRFWAGPEVGLIERTRARYRPRSADTFVEAARLAWEETGTKHR